MSTLDTWAQDKLSVFLGFDPETIRSQVLPYLMSTQTPEAFGERLMEMVGLSEDALKFIEEFTERRFHPERRQNVTTTTTATTSSTASSSNNNSNNRMDTPTPESFPDLPTTQQPQETLWPVNISVHHKKEDEYFSNSRKSKKKNKSNNDLRSAAILTDKPKQEKKKKKEMTLETALKELNIKSDTKRKPCLCQATKHELLIVAPNCLNCGKIICVAEGVGPCTFCHSPILSSDQEAALIAEAKRKRAAQNQPQKRETVSTQGSVGYAARVNGELFSQMYLFDDDARKPGRQQSDKTEGSKRKVMTIDSKSKQVIIENIESASSSEDNNEPIIPSTRRGRDAFSAGTYANNPLLKEDIVPKYVGKKKRSNQKQKDDRQIMQT